MENSTIQLSKETKKKISSFGTKGESYDQILNRIYSIAVKEQIRIFLMDDKDTITLEKFKKEVERKWPKSK